MARLARNVARPSVPRFRPDGANHWSGPVGTTSGAIVVDVDVEVDVDVDVEVDVVSGVVVEVDGVTGAWLAEAASLPGTDSRWPPVGVITTARKKKHAATAAIATFRRQPRATVVDPNLALQRPRRSRPPG